MRLEAFLTIVVLAAAIASVAVTLTMAKISRPIRSFFEAQGESRDTKFVREYLAVRAYRRLMRFMHELFSCPYCTSHWLAFFAVAVYQPTLITSRFRLVDLGVSAFVIVAVSSFFVGLIYLALRAIHAGDEDDE